MTKQEFNAEIDRLEKAMRALGNEEKMPEALRVLLFDFFKDRPVQFFVSHNNSFIKKQAHQKASMN